MDEVCSMSIAEAFAPLVTSGVPAGIVFVGDPNQLPTQCISKVAECMFGTKSVVDLALRNPRIFKRDER